jgi:hypothetical protein
MMKKQLFGWFWGMVLMAMPFFLKIGNVGEPIFSKDWLFIVCSFLSIALFGIKINSIRGYCFAAMIPIAAFGLAEISSISCLMQLVWFSCGCLMFIQFEERLKDEETAEIIKNCAYLTSIIFSLWAIQEQFTSFNIYEQIYRGLKVMPGQGISIAGPLANPGYSAGFLAISIPLYFTKRKILSIFLPLAGMFIYGGTTVWISLAIGFLCLLISFRNKILAWILALSGVVSGTAIIASNTIDLGGSDRWFVWQHALGMMLDVRKILFGHGLGYLGPYMRKAHITTQAFVQMHNDWLEALFVFGIIGLIPILVIIYSLAKNSVNKIGICGIIIAMMWATTWFPFHLAPLFILILMWYGISLNDNTEI